jgi:SHS2 domain-containing protein
MNGKAGYREIQHTADWQLEAWAPDLAGLLVQCARGMQALSGVRLDPEAQPEWRRIELFGLDPESLLVSFLSELLYISEQESLGFEAYELDLDGLDLQARVQVRALLVIEKEIKAVTYHNLEIESTPDGLITRVVFDV